LFAQCAVIVLFPPNVFIPKCPPSAACASVTSLNISRNSLQPHHVPALQELICQFPSIEKLDMSFNPALGCKGVVALLTSLSGTCHRVRCRLHHALTFFFAESQTSKIKILSVSCTGFENQDVDIMSYHFLKFPRLEDLDISSNSLDTGAINRMISTFAGISAVILLYSLFYSLYPSLSVFSYGDGQENASETTCIH
jgi:hypothetical protein